MIQNQTNDTTQANINPAAKPSVKQYSTGLHWVIFRYALLMAFVALVIFGYLTQFKTPGVVVLIIAVGMWADALLRYMNITFTVVGDCLSINTGLFTKVTRNIDLQSIESVDVMQSWVARWLDYGQVVIRVSVDNDIDFIALSYVAAPGDLKARLGK